MPRVAARNLVLAACAAALSACAPLPAEPTAETVDERTGVTVARLARPIELIIAEGRGSLSDPFAYLAPFETNRMGERALYLWTAAPQEPTGASAPTLLADGEPFAVTPVSGAVSELGLSQAPYAAPAPWSIEHYYRIDRPLLERLGRARRVELIVPASDAASQRYVADAAALAPLLEFIARAD